MAHKYTDLVTPVELEIADGMKLVFSVSKTKEGSPHVDIRTWVDTETYSGPTKRGINFDAEWLYDFQEIIDKLVLEVDKLPT